jgi:hypothetical protein
MGFLLLSVQYPSEANRNAFIREAGPHVQAASSSFHKPLSVSATDDQWRSVIAVLKEKVDPSILNSDDDELRPLKPNDDNYEAFTGSQWKPKGVLPIPPELAMMLGDADRAPIPHYDRCCKCTKVASNRCAKCKMVKYCSRECQSKHWKLHKTSCTKAQKTSLWSAMHGNDGFLITPQECKTLSIALTQQFSSSFSSSSNTDDIVQCFGAYFEFAADLDGCFVI